ncbi:flavin monoamine oxidase family protein [Methylolobus aquaticus]
MLETAIVGAGLCGLKLAHHLRAQGSTFAVFEARGRLGGRILSVDGGVAGMALDLGPSWFWPDTQPRIARLVEDLGLQSFPQHDTGEVLNLTDHDKPAEALARPDLHGGARRIEGGMGALVAALSRDLPATALHFDHVLTGVVDRGDHVVLNFRCGSEVTEILARRVVLAMPPRLVEERVRFEPLLDGQLREAMRETYTWMADQAKAVIGYDRAFWRAAGQSGNAFVHHEHVVLGEIYDACDASGDKAALGAFFALSAEQRAAFRGGMPMLIASQLVQVFGPDADSGEQHIQDWADEPYTCSMRDRTPPDDHPEYGHPALRRAQWGGKLLFGGSETASYGGGYLEGALEAAARIQRTLIQSIPVTRADLILGDAPNAASLSSFRTWVNTRRSDAFERYRRHLNQKLASQLREQITQRAVLGTMEQIYSEALAVIEDLPFEPDQEANSELTYQLLSPFVGFNKALLDQVLAFNRTSCALSNFPDEHVVSPEYLETIARDLAAAWREFAFGVDAQIGRRAPAVDHIATAA